ncbi:MAG: glycosyltransferase, partial [Bacteroidales bacterium]|nr:glycosyltransferase [Bacteroidales bacterium]
MNTTPPILSVNVSDSSGGAARAAYRIHCAVNQYGANSRMLVRDKTLNDETILSVSQFDHPSPIKHIYRYIQNKLKNKAQHYRLDKYPGKEDVFMSDLRSASIHGAFQKIDFDILHLHWINLRFLDLKELQNVHKPIVWTLHDCWPFTGICHYFYDCDRYVKSCGNCPFLHSGKENDLSHQIWKQKKQLYNELDLHIVTPSRWLAEAARKSSL